MAPTAEEAATTIIGPRSATEEATTEIGPKSPAEKATTIIDRSPTAAKPPGAGEPVSVHDAPTRVVDAGAGDSTTGPGVPTMSGREERATSLYVRMRNIERVVRDGTWDDSSAVTKAQLRVLRERYDADLQVLREWDAADPLWPGRIADGDVRAFLMRHWEGPLQFGSP